MNLESQSLDSDPEEKPQKSKAVDLLQAFGCGLLFIGALVGFLRLSSLLVTIPPLSWIPTGKSGPASGVLPHWAGSTPLYWLILIVPASLFLTRRRNAKLGAMNSEEKTKARLRKGKMTLIAIPLWLTLLWFFDGFDVLKLALAFLIVFVLMLSAAVAIYRWRRKKGDEPPGVKVI